MKYGALLVLLISADSIAVDNPYLARSPEGLLMGDAFTAVNDDSFTLFYNPATLGRHKEDFTLYPINPSFNGTNVLNDLDRFEDFPDEPVGVADVLMDYPVHASAGVAPTLKLFNFGVTFLAQDSYDVLLRNRTHPMLELDLRNDRGVLFGFGIPLGPGRISRKSKMGSQTSFGLSAKYIERTGIKDTLALSGTTVVDSLGQDELAEVLKTIGRVKGVGWGFDAGLEHVVRHGSSQFVVGLSALDINGTEFTVPENEKKITVASNRDQVNFGLATGQEFKFFHYIVSADVRALNEDIDFGKRLRFGAQVGVPGLKLLGGVNSGYYSYGATLNLGFIKLTGGLYDVELGSKYKQTKSKRFVLYLSLFDFSFDA